MTLGIVYFIMGYILFAILFASVGAVVPTYREGQQIVFFIMPAGIIPLMLVPFLAENYSHPVTQILTLFPITAPITSMIRLCVGNMSSWELMLNITLLVLSIVGLILLAAKVFRAFLLMYGRKPSLREITKALRQA